MTDKERVLAFFHHEMTDELPPDKALLVVRGNTFHERPPFVQDGIDWFGVPWKREDNINALAPDYRPDVIMFHDDYGTQTNMFFSPEVWREFFKPQLKKAVDKTHELGMIFELHSCGFMEQIVPEFAEIGVDSWQGQEINDIPTLKAVTGNKLAYHTTPQYQDFEGAICQEL
ncbi:methylcobalamin:coenzyme M methyltransferase [uncultured Roseburia sp.]|uniref:Uroporphyrinogen decarboxylase (URO-D) domain-containing protein n=1 Tax=Brotonthovivens ammoniilytica TaxID=2981725 RepID=A0ABT2TFF4_9FIRM|nr:uroporphyrinogen decarboxylase family protein [Brotonthovivens ammoniilytica]MCU6760872.1 hypothetical protein [Brotonthovivens ammoniilytica]SCI11826.1 methylcobalamin:coenzyme M methyltransferase [uncultured Roseburia sp.]